MPEFDQYARDYPNLLYHPIRERFAPASKFFLERKWMLLQDYFSKCGLQPHKSRWLDVGCGRGELLELGSPTFGEAVGCDVSPEMIQNVSGARVVVQCETTCLPFPDASFDLITAVCVYHHVALADRPQLTAEVARLLRAGGTACVIEHNPFNPITQWIVSSTPVDAHARLLSSQNSRRLLEQQGLRHAKTSYFLYFPERLYAGLRGLETMLTGVPLGGQYAVFARKS